MEKIVLDNGVRILVESIKSVQSAAIGLWCTTGSRHEYENEAGITHLIEHMLFKGTPTRTAKEIAEAIEGRGGGLNAFTDKENTCYYCRVLMDEVETGLDVLSDMMLHSLIDSEELGREKGVVLEEIKRSLDEPGDYVHDLHLEARWDGHPLGKPIIGTPESVSSFGRDDLVRYMERRYLGGHVVLSVSGNVEVENVRAWAEQRLGKIPAGSDVPKLPRPTATIKNQYLARDVEQVHFCIGTDGCSIYDDEIYTLAILDSALGGGMSSRLFQEVRERRGLAYSVGSYTQSYAAGGVYTIYGGTGKETWPQVQEIVRTELDKVMKDGLSEAELERTRRQFAGHMVLSLEGMSSRMMRNARNEINHGREIPVEETLGKINAVTNTQITEMARKLFSEEMVATTAIGPAE